MPSNNNQDTEPSKALAVDMRDKVVYAKFTPEFLTECLRYFVDPDTNLYGISEARFAQLCKLNQRTIYNYLHPDKKGKYRYPDNDALKSMGEQLKVHFVADWSGRVSNDDVLELIKAQHAFHR